MYHPSSFFQNQAQSNQDFVNRLTPVWGKEESEAIIKLVWEDFSGKRLLTNSLDQIVWQEEWFEKLEKILQRLEKSEPLHYVLGKAWFMDFELKVNSSVLIPRPETEELVHWVLETKDQTNKTVLDLCTGSGCIALALRKKGHWLSVSGLDVSKDALEVALQNGQNLNLGVDWIEADLLATEIKLHLPGDVWVSNPPYVLLSESSELAAHVIDYEPHIALFVPLNDPIIFYSKILELGIEFLPAGGVVYFELNPLTAEWVKEAFLNFGYEGIEFRKDMFGKVRMIRGFRPLQ